MSASEKELDQIFGQGHWEAPNLLDLRIAFTSLDSTMKALAESPGWEGASAAAASEKWLLLQKAFDKVANSVGDVRTLITKGNDALAAAKSALDGAPTVAVPKELRAAASVADAGALIFVPALGSFHPASEAVDLLTSFLGNKRAAAAKTALTMLETDLTSLAVTLDAVDFSTDFWDVPEPQKPTPIPDPSDSGGTPPPSPTPGFRTGGGYTPPPNPVYTTPTYPGGSTSTPIIGDPSYPYNPGYPSPSVDDRSVGTLPDGSGGSDPRYGVGDPRYGGGVGSGSGSGSGVNGAVFGGAAAAGAATLRLGTGGGFGGGMGGGGLGGGLGAGAAGGSGGLLGSGTSGAGTAGSGAGSGAAGAGTGAAGTGNRGGLMGGQQMGGGGQGGKKEKRAGLGGPIAPKLEDDEAEFVPLPDGARAGGRDISVADES
ncbi:MAG: hypothetical protein HGA51_00770 [Demequinaceae bacterium]|nr:hypothetical protein [Demequinaceae bacterium]